MNAVHPTFAPFLRAACPPQPPGLLDVIRAKDAVIRSYQPPPCPIGWLEYVYKAGRLEIVCHLECEAGERGIDSPDIAPSATLVDAYIRGAEVSEYLDADIIKLIEIKAAATLEE